MEARESLNAHTEKNLTTRRLEYFNTLKILKLITGRITSYPWKWPPGLVGPFFSPPSEPGSGRTYEAKNR